MSDSLMSSNDQIHLHIPLSIFHWRMRMRFELGWADQFDETGAHDPIWIGMSQQDDTKIDIVHHGIKLCVSLNDKIIADESAESLQDHDFLITVEDSMEPQPCVLRIQSYGFTDQHMPLTGVNVSTRAAVRLAALDFEGIDVINIFREDAIWIFHDSHQAQGGDFWSSNVRTEFNFITPVYRWLMDNQQRINQGFGDDQKP